MSAAYLKGFNNRDVKTTVGSGPSAKCLGKHRYDSPVVARGIVNRYDHPREKLSVYRCNSCGKWHIGGLTRYSNAPNEGYRKLVRVEP